MCIDNTLVPVSRILRSKSDALAIKWCRRTPYTVSPTCSGPDEIQGRTRRGCAYQKFEPQGIARVRARIVIRLVENEAIETGLVVSG